MSILIPVHSMEISLNEIPDHMSLCILLGECSRHCKGCHSPHLWKPVEHKISLDDLMEQAEQQIKKGANAICLMGDTANGLTRTELCALITNLNILAPVCLYSGEDDLEALKSIINRSLLSWVKVGSYKESLGGLQSPTTNQRFYKVVSSYVFTGECIERCDSHLIDCTEDFQR